MSTATRLVWRWMRADSSGASTRGQAPAPPLVLVWDADRPRALPPDRVPEAPLPGWLDTLLCVGAGCTIALAAVAASELGYRVVAALR